MRKKWEQESQIFKAYLWGYSLASEKSNEQKERFLTFTILTILVKKNHGPGTQWVALFGIIFRNCRASQGYRDLCVGTVTPPGDATHGVDVVDLCND